MIEIKRLSSLEKVFLNDTGDWEDYSHGTMLINERFSFQVALRNNADSKGKIPLDVKIDSDISKCIRINEVKSVPVEFPSYSIIDENYISNAPGLYPDLLTEYSKFSLLTNMWTSLWVFVEPDETITNGEYKISINFANEHHCINISTDFIIKIYNVVSPRQKLIHTEWLHCDCIANFHKVKVWSEDFWVLFSKYIKMATNYGVNMILTPIFTPPLDTEFGGERRTVQLIDVSILDGRYQFNFDKLERWIDTCTFLGVDFFEFSHLFSQWGAGFSPKIIVEVNGEYLKKFGWHVKSNDPEYVEFLNVFLPALLSFVGRKGVREKCLYHISDEPSLENLDQYKKASELVREHLKDEIIIDALSEYEFLSLGILEKPIPALDHLQKFIDNEVENLWTYYCCGQNLGVSNRFIAMPSARNRILGIQLYKYNIEGFLHWGFNFYNSRSSLKEINPYLTTDADCGFPAGDAFLVYPTSDGVTESIRLVVFAEGLQDLRALQLLDSLTSREESLAFLLDCWDEEITLIHYPMTADFFHYFREKLNSKISALTTDFSTEVYGMK